MVSSYLPSSGKTGLHSIRQLFLGRTAGVNRRLLSSVAPLRKYTGVEACEGVLRKNVKEDVSFNAMNLFSSCSFTVMFGFADTISPSRICTPSNVTSRMGLVRSLFI